MAFKDLGLHFRSGHITIALAYIERAHDDLFFVKADHAVNRYQLVMILAMR